MKINYLLDTHILIWLAQKPENISSSAKQVLVSKNRLFVSQVSVWEMAIKIKTGKLQLGQDLTDFILMAIINYGVVLLPISLEHIYFTQQLELHHRDPFDRLLLAQAQIENLFLISSDEIFDLYNVERIWK